MNELIRTALAASGNSIEIDGDTGGVRVRDEAFLRSHGVDALVYLAVFGPPEGQPVARWLIWEAAQSLSIRPASIHDLYIGRGHDRLPHTFTTPAMNLRAMTYDIARAAFSAAIKGKVGAFIFELSRSEMAYTQQRPAEYTTAILAAAIKEGFRGPVFLQGDHLQVNAKNYVANTDAELSGLRHLVNECIHAGFYNIELDSSTLTDMSKATPVEQQHPNVDMCALLSDYVRTHQPPNVVISIGGEIGETSSRNSDARDLHAFMDYYNHRIRHHPGLSKLSVRAGTSPGGVVMPDGTVALMTVDFETLHELSAVARREYAMGGVAQHGASTLPQEILHRFVQAGAIEVHLATAFQNMLFEKLPAALVSEMYDWLFMHAAADREPNDTDRQFVYKTRRLATGPFKKLMWNISDFEKAEIRREFEGYFTRLFNGLGVVNTTDTIASVVSAHPIHKKVDEFVVAAVKAMPHM